MARVFIDPHMFSSAWFEPVLRDLINEKKVTFLFSNCEKGLQELRKVRAALEFRKRMIAIKRATEAPENEVEAHANQLTSHPDFVGCKECDDPHIMAAIFIHPTKFIFSGDKRLAKCRQKMNGKINKRFLAFILVTSEAVFLEHRPSIFR